jgi:hypothetical protein
MFICRNCGKFSKKPIEQKKRSICPKCEWDYTRPINGPEPVAIQVGSVGGGTVALHPGFVGVINLTPRVTPVSEGAPRTPGQKFVLNYSESVDIPGTAYHHILPTQDRVSRNIVGQKMELIKEMRAKGVLPEVGVGKEKLMKGLALSYDGHHTFVAALRLGSPIILLLCGGLENAALASWVGCTYVDRFDNERDPHASEFSFMPPVPPGWPK